MPPKNPACPKCTFDMIHKTTVLRGIPVYWWECERCYVQSPLVTKENDNIHDAVDWAREERYKHCERNR